MSSVGKLSLVVLLFLLAFNGCSEMTKAKPAAEEAMSTFHENYNSADFRAIYDNSHDDFKQASTYESFDELLQAVHSKLGKVVSTENQTWNVRTFNFKTSITIQQKTDFEKGSAAETFVYGIKDDKAILVGYNINSRDLIVQ